MSTGTEENLKWMYEGKNSSIDHEQYLLGKKIPTLHDADQEKGDFSIKPQSSIATGNVTVLEKLDYESKVREDPLFQIQKNDYEHRKELLSNPFKKKRIQKLLKNALEKDLRESLAKNNESDSSSLEMSDSNSSDDSDEVSRKFSKKSLRDENLRKALKRKLEQDLQHNRHRKFEKDVDLTEVNTSTRSGKGHKELFDCGVEEMTRKAGYGLIHAKNNEHKIPIAGTRKRQERRALSRDQEKPKYIRKHKSGFSRKLTEEELEKKRKEMMDNASWRDKQRKGNVKKFAMEEKRERDRETQAQQTKQKAEKKGGKARDFLHDMKLHSASMGSLEDTVRRKKHTLSRR